jgi:hypothetical protein
MDELYPYFRISSKSLGCHPSFRICMDRNLFLPLSWEELKWWVNTLKWLVNDILEGRPCGAHSVVAKVEEYFKDQLSQPFDLTPDLCGWISCEFRNQVELALIAFAKARKTKAHTQWLKVKKRR